MPKVFTNPFFAAAVSFLTAVVLTFAVRGFARRRGVVAADAGTVVSAIY